MKLGKYDITIKNVWAYIQGNTRKIVDELGPDILKSPKHIQEQILWRKVIHNPKCSEKGSCIECHCTVPDKFYSDKECEGGCYPSIMDESKWIKFNQMCLRRKIDIFKDKFDWDVIISDVDHLGDTYYSSIICFDKAIVDLGECQAGTLLEHRFELFNPDKEDLVINSISISCSCGKAIIPKPIKLNEFGYLICTVDTNNKMLNKQYDLWFTIRYNEIKRMNFKLIYKTK